MVHDFSGLDSIESIIKIEPEEFEANQQNTYQSANDILRLSEDM